VLYFRHLRDPHLTLEAGLAAIASQDRREAERIASLLEQRGHTDYAAYLRAKHQLTKAERLLESTTRLVREEEIERAARVALYEAEVLAPGFHPHRALVAADMGTIPAALRLSPRRQERAKLDGLIAAACLAAHEYVRQIPSDSKLRVEGAIIAGECLGRVGDARGAAAAWSYVVERRPDHMDAHRHLAVIYVDTGALRSAIQHLESLARLDPEDGRPHRQIGLLMKEDKQSRLAIAAYEEALRRKLAPAVRAEVIMELAAVWLGEGEADYGKALDLLKQCPADYANRPEVLTLRAEGLWKSRRNEAEALAELDRALRLDPELVEALILRARIHLDLEQSSAAIPFLERAIRLRPHQLDARGLLALAYARLAASVDTPARGMISPIVDALYWRYMRAKSTESRLAREKLEQQIAELSRLSRQAMEAVWDDQIRYEIGKLWLEMGNPSLARSWFQAALTCNREHDAAAKEIRALERGNSTMPPNNK
jgi:tetratricopeptide (TPR) repeat protein